MYSQYGQSFNPQQSQLLQQMMAPQPVQQNTVRVNGRPGAEAYNLAPNSDAILLDNTAPMIWLVQTDGAGYKSLTPYDISPHVEVKQEDVIKKLESRIDKLEEKINGKSNSTDVKSRKSEQRNVTGICSDDER